MTRVLTEQDEHVAAPVQQRRDCAECPSRLLTDLAYQRAAWQSRER
jgi:hypothetical protein